jgi:hypothetical protein
MENRLQAIEGQINRITSENIQFEQKIREGKEAELLLIENREKLKDLMQDYFGE